jgi:hypothetical protein
LHNPDFKDQFVAHAKQRSALLVRTFYERLGRDTGKNLLVWGDKTPGYADPLLSRGCLDFSREVFPDARWIHIRRDPRAVVHSLVAKKWHTLASAVDIWARITKTGREFGRTLPAHQYLEIAHEDVLRDIEAVTGRLLKFLNLEMTAEVVAFVEREKTQRQPISDPINLSIDSQDHSVRHGLNEQQLGEVTALLRDRFDDVESLLNHYDRTEAGQATAKAIAAGAAVSVVPESGESQVERAAAPQGFSVFTALNQDTFLGDLEARMVGTSVLIDGQVVVPHGAATVHAGDRVDIAIRVMALKHFAHLVAGFSILDRTGQVVASGNNASSGLGTLDIGAGVHTLLLSFRWPELGEGAYSITLGVGEGIGNAADGESNHVQCWAPEAIQLRQRTKQLPAGTTLTVNMMHASLGL